VSGDSTARDLVMLDMVEQHHRAFFDGHDIAVVTWLPGPAARLFPNLRVLVVSPGPRTGLWSYVSVGACLVRDESRLEFVIHAAKPDSSLTELVTMATYYHYDLGLGHGHTLPIGRPWLPESTCDHFLVSLPYPLGPEFEICDTADGTVHTLWLLPITKSERDFKVREGLEALEQRFGEKELQYWQTRRESLA